MFFFLVPVVSQYWFDSTIAIYMCMYLYMYVHVAIIENHFDILLSKVTSNLIQLYWSWHTFSGFIFSSYSHILL